MYTLLQDKPQWSTARWEENFRFIENVSKHELENTINVFRKKGIWEASSRGKTKRQEGIWEASSREKLKGRKGSGRPPVEEKLKGRKGSGRPPVEEN